MANNKKRSKTAGRTDFGELAVFITGAYVLVVFCIHPLAVTDAYFNILETKYLFYCGTAFVAMAALLVAGLYTGRIINFFKEFDLKRNIKALNVVDWAIIIFWIFNVLSWVFCFDWRHEAFWGTSGRYNGVFLMTIYLVMYFLVTRFFRFRRWYLDAFLVSGTLVSIFGIGDFFRADMLGFKVNMVDEQADEFFSTIGQMNAYTAYIALIVVVAAILFAIEKDRRRMILYYICMTVSMFAIIVGLSENAYISLAVLFGFSPFLLFRTKTGVRRYIISLATFFSVIWGIARISAAMGDGVIEISGLFAMLSGTNLLMIAAVVLWIAAAVAVAIPMLRKRQITGKSQTGSKSAPAVIDDDDSIGNWLRYIWIGVVAVVVIAILYILYDANIAGNAEKYDAISDYVVFNESWGNRRGYAWITFADVYRDKFTPLQKIFGYGADNTKLFTMLYFNGRFDSMGNYVIFENLHNEYLNFFATIGPFGMLAYITFIVSAIVAMAKNLKKHPEVAAILFAVLAYALQAVVNINTPVVFPVVITLIGVGVCKKNRESQ